ncbi:hypothetical protein V9T40_002025 [Parthenolecanium corni]|uniref:Uncharacterized protein n=1 Tax=Parthenolecanium corni TaxID=536013 RepID=A0AAN9TTR8_9HEMI
MSQWIFTQRPSASTQVPPQFEISQATVHHLEYIFQDFKPYLLELDTSKNFCSMQFNRRVFRAEIESRLINNKLYYIGVQGVFEPKLVYHPNSTVLINEPDPVITASTAIVSAKAADWGRFSPPSTLSKGPLTIEIPPAPPMVVNTPAETAPIITVIKISWNSRLPLKDPNTNSLHILAPFDFVIPANSCTIIELGFAVVLPKSFCLKLECLISNKHIFLKETRAVTSFHEPLSLTFINTHPKESFRVIAESLIASATCHRVLPSEILVLNDEILRPAVPPATSTPPNSIAEEDDEPPRKKI